jgi:hypothetical protein
MAAQYPVRHNQGHPLRKFLPLVLVLVVGVSGALLYYNHQLDWAVDEVNKLLVSTGLKSQPAPSFGGNPDARVWIDLHTAMYYCPGSPLYGKTEGRYAKQADAQRDHFEPASRQACE